MNIQVQVRSQDMNGGHGREHGQEAWKVVIAPSRRLSMGTEVGSTVKRWQPSIHLPWPQDVAQQSRSRWQHRDHAGAPPHLLACGRGRTR